MRSVSVACVLDNPGGFCSSTAQSRTITIIEGRKVCAFCRNWVGVGSLGEFLLATSALNDMLQVPRLRQTITITKETVLVVTIITGGLCGREGHR